MYLPGIHRDVSEVTALSLEGVPEDNIDGFRRILKLLYPFWVVCDQPRKWKSFLYSLVGFICMSYNTNTKQFWLILNNTTQSQFYYDFHFLKRNRIWKITLFKPERGVFSFLFVAFSVCCSFPRWTLGGVLFRRLMNKS